MDRTPDPPRRALRELPVPERPRERLCAHGAAALSASELIAVVWGTGGPLASSITLAEGALRSAGSLGELARADVLELTRLAGVGPARAAQLLAAFEIGRRATVANGGARWTIRAPRDVADRLLAEMGRLEREELRVLLLNAKNVVLRQVTVYQGNVSAALVRVAELFRDAVRVHAAGVIVVHNHPSGDPAPSRSDQQLTTRLGAAAELLQIRLLDHIILGSADNGRQPWFSFREAGIL